MGLKAQPQYIPDAELNHQSIKIQMVEEVEEDHYTPSQNPGEEDMKDNLEVKMTFVRDGKGFINTPGPQIHQQISSMIGDESKKHQSTPDG